MKGNKLIISMVMICCFLTGESSKAQVRTEKPTGAVNGFVYDAETGAPIYMATVSLIETTFGGSTEENGFFNIRNIPVGQYMLEARFVGYESHRMSVGISSVGALRLVIKLKSGVTEIEEAIVSGEREQYKRISPVSTHRLTPEKMRLMPSMGVTPDIAEALQILPGITFTGDRGGQFYVQGGSPIHNRTLIDGMTIISPFHSIGSVSVFDSDILQSVDVFKSAFSAEYGGRVSSIIDVRTRPGNRTKTTGAVSQSNIGMTARLEGPIIPMTDKRGQSVSYLISSKNSILKTTAPILYPWLDSIGLPYRYNDFFGKISVMDRNGNQIDFTGLHFSDAITSKKTITNKWNTTGAGLSYILSPLDGTNLFVTRLTWSKYNSRLEIPNKPNQSTIYENFDLSMKGIHLMRNHELRWGAEFSTVHTNHSFTGFDGRIKSENNYTSDVVLFATSRISLPRWVIEPGLHMRIYSSVFKALPEPRLKIRYNINEYLSLNAAGGLYSQNLSATTSEEEVVSIFQGFYTGIDLIQDYFEGERIFNPTQRAWHAVFGLSWFGKNNLRLSMEGYFKNFWLLVNYNAHQIYNAHDELDRIPEYLSKFFLYEKGWSYGIDWLIDWSRPNWSVWIAYSLGFITRQDEFATYTPHWDRKHNLNLVFSYKFGKTKQWNARCRWQLASGFPFTQTAGYYEDYGDIDGTLTLDPEENGPVGVIYGPRNGGRLPGYHRLDFSVHRIWSLQKDQEIELSASLMNAYNRENIFYYNRITHQRINQLPIMPSAGIIFRF